MTTEMKPTSTGRMAHARCRLAGLSFVVTAVTASFGGCKFDELPPLESDAADSDAAALTDGATGPAALTVTQGPHDFGPVAIGESSLLSVTVTNAGGETTGPVTVGLGGTVPAAFQIVPTGDSSDCAGARLAGGATCVAQVRFVPTTDGTPTARLDLSAVPGGGVSVTLSGEAVTPANLTTTQVAYDFGDIVMGQPSSLLSVIVRNNGEQTTGAVSVTVGGPHAGDFQVVPTGMPNDCSGAVLANQQTCNAQVRFRPTVATLRMGDLTVSATPGGTVTVPLTGDGLTPGNLALDMPVGGAMLEFGMREFGTGGSSTPSTIRVRNSGGSASGVLDVTIGGGGGSYTIATDACDGRMLAASATCDVAVRFNPLTVGSIPATITVRDTVAMTAASVSASGIGSARLAVTKTSAGTITSTPTGVSCAAGCTSQVGTFIQTPVSLTATADAGWIFSAWTGACTSATPSPVCSVPLTQGLTNVGATFTQVFTLNVTATGGGTVTSATAGIVCGNGNTDCAQTYPVNTAVQLNAEPDAGWEVFSWSGTGASCAAGARTCTAQMNQTRNVAVVFRRQYTLTVSKLGLGIGAVTSSVGGLSCGAACSSTSATYWDGETVDLSQAAGTDSAFVGWGNGCTGTGSCSVAMTATRTVTAEFKRQYLLTINVSGAGAGTVTVQPGNFTCSTAQCTRFYDGGSNLTLTATPASALDGVGSITGACTSSPCMVTGLSSARTVNATFVRYQCAPSTQTCTSGNFTQCDSAGNYVSFTIPNRADGSPATISMNAYSCPMGCHATQPTCADIDASNGFNAALDDASATSSTGLDLVLPRDPTATGVIRINTDEYDEATGKTIITDADGGQVSVPVQMITQQAGAPGIMVLKVRSFTLRSGRAVEVSGTRALGIASHFDVYIAGSIDLSAVLGTTLRTAPGSISSPVCNGLQGPGTGAHGGAGGAEYGGSGNGAPGGASLQDNIEPLRGGCSGGDGGGGAVQVVSRTRIVLAASALIDLSGAGGQALAQWFAYGGSSGGAALFQAPLVRYDPGSVVAGRGGAGGAMSQTSVAHGSEGPTAGTAGAPSLTCGGCASSGAGGTETIGPGNGTGTWPQQASGGGGSVGRSVTSNRTMVVDIPVGTMKIKSRVTRLMPR